jgi:hypothetical protein
MDFKHKYLKYKIKYLELKKLEGGHNLKNKGFTGEQIKILNRYLNKDDLNKIEILVDRGAEPDSILKGIKILNHMEWIEDYNKREKKTNKSYKEEKQRLKDEISGILDNYIKNG